MPDATALSSAPAATAAAASGDGAGARALAERQVEALGELVGIGLKIARAIERQVDAAGEGPEGLAELNAAAIAFARVARAVRQTMMLQSKLQEARGAAAAKAQDLKARLGRIVRRAIGDQHGETEQAERLAAESAERLEQEFLGEGPTRPVSEIVADICKDLGLNPDWQGLAAEIAAAEAFARGDAHADAVDRDDETGPIELYWLDEHGRPTPAPEYPYTARLNRERARVRAEQAALRRDSS